MRAKTTSESLVEGDILLDTKSRLRHRVLFLSENDVVLFNMDAPANSTLKVHSSANANGARRPAPATPESWPYPQVIARLHRGTFEKVQDDAVLILPEQRRPKEAAFNARAVAIVEFLQAPEYLLYDPETRAKLVREAVREFGVSRQTVYKYLRIFWGSGKKPGALVSFFRNCGAPGQRRSPGTKKRGRPRSPAMRAALGVGVNVANDDIEHIRDAVKQYQNNPQWILEDAYDWLRDTHYAKLVSLEDGRRARRHDPAKVMTFEQFEYHANRFMTKENKDRRGDEKSRKSWKKGRRHAGRNASKPEVGEIAEIDALRTNWSIVPTKNRALVIGSAIVVIVVEMTGGLIMGLAVGLDGEDYELVVEALVNCVTDKVALCKRYGLDITADDWPPRALCQRLHADRGSAFLGNLSDRIAMVMSPNPLVNTGPNQPQSKGTVENTVLLLKKMIRRRFPGTWFGKISARPRGSRSPHERATHTLDELRTELLDIAMQLNARVRPSSRTRPDLVARGVDSSPLSIVKDALHTQRHRFRRVEPIALEQALLPRFPGTVSLDGIYIGDELYYAPAAESDMASAWYRELELSEAKVQVALHRGTVNVAFLCVPGRQERFVRCALLPKSREFANMSLAEVKALRKERSTIDRTKNATSAPERVERSAATRARTRRAQAETRTATGNVPPNQRDISGRRQNRSEEKAHQREELNERLRGQGNPTSPSKEPVAHPQSSANDLGYPDVDDI